MKKRERLSIKFLKLSKKMLLSALLIVVSSATAYAQQDVVKGVVSDKEGEPIPGVSVMVKGTDNGTITNLDGVYELKVEDAISDVLIFSYIGMLAQEVSVNSRTEINVALEDDVVGLDEVVVVGYGTQEIKDVTGSVALVGQDDMESRLNTQIGSLIQGKAAGVQILSSSGKPSQGLSIRIRGTNSINTSSEPLYVIDGVPTADTRSINPADVESISILKDASSAAIYGAQGANGVVIITTKKGSTEKPRVSLDAYVGRSQVWNTLSVLNADQYRDLMMEMGQTTDWTRYTENTDWQNEIFQNGLSQNVQLSVSGKTKSTNYYFSGGYMEQVGAVRSSQMDRANFKINLDQEINDWLTVGTRMTYTIYSDVDVNDHSAVNHGGVLTGAINTPPIIGIYNEDGTFTSNPFQNWENPISSTDGSDREYNHQRILGNFYAKINFTKELSFRSSYGIDNAHGVYDYFLDPYRTSYGRALSGQGRNNTNKSSYYMIENILSFDKDFARHTVKLQAGAISQKFLWENNNIERRNYASDAITTVNGGSEIVSASSDKAEKANSSFLGRVNYDFADRYLLTANFRMDGSSNFGPQNRWGFFPSFSLGWRISEESFMKNLGFIDDLKIRAGWGIVGNDQIGNYAYFGKVGIGANYPIGGVTMPGTYPASIENQTLKWEESEQTNIGLDFSVLNGKVRLNVDAYQKTTSDILLNAPLPRTTGFDNAVQNIGVLENKGIEFSLSTVNFDSKFKWTTDFNISFNKNEVVDIVGQEMFFGGIAGRGEASLVKEGEPLGTLYGYIYGGVDPATGDAFYIDRNGESTFTPEAEDRVVIGDANPDFIFGLTNSFEYRGIGLTLFFEGKYGNDMLNATRIDSEGMTDPKNQTIAVANRWRQAGDVTDIPRASWGNTNNSRISTRFIEDGSYVRLKTLTLSYQLPKTLISKIKLGGVRVYVTGENLLTFTNYSGFDPEVNTFGGSNTAKGIDYGTYPQTRNVIIGANITF